jgi:hypothetical protein
MQTHTLLCVSFLFLSSWTMSPMPLSFCVLARGAGGSARPPPRPTRSGSPLPRSPACKPRASARPPHPLLLPPTVRPVPPHLDVLSSPPCALTHVHDLHAPLTQLHSCTACVSKQCASTAHSSLAVFLLVSTLVTQLHDLTQSESDIRPTSAWQVSTLLR